MMVWPGWIAVDDCGFEPAPAEEDVYSPLIGCALGMDAIEEM